MHVHIFDIANCPYQSLVNGRVDYNTTEEINLNYSCEDDTSELSGGFRFGTNLAYSCNEGYYRKSGWRSRICQQSGNWSGYPSICEGNKICNT